MSTNNGESATASWNVASERGTATLTVGQRFRFAYEPAEMEWEITGPPIEIIESDWDENGQPVFRCRQRSGDTTLYRNDRREDGTIDFCGDEIANAVLYTGDN